MLPLNIESLKNLDHLSGIGPEKLITDIGLYTPILIDTYSEKTSYTLTSKSISISQDVKSLYSLLHIDHPLYLPCSACQKRLAFNQIRNMETGKDPTASSLPVPENQIVKCSSKPSDYSLYSNTLFLVPSFDPVQEDFDTAAASCKKVILDNLSFFLVELHCSLEKQHTIRCLFSLTSPTIDQEIIETYQKARIAKLHAKCLNEPVPTLTPEEDYAWKVYEFAAHTIILKKVGQYPSMADMEFFDLRRYKRVLKSQYSELTRAMGLYASGVGIGAFVYLRRIFERLAEQAHQNCISHDGWDETAYLQKRFNEKIDYLESFGERLLPDELSTVKQKLYGLLSKGIHDYSETDCLELFPYLKSAVELILDQKLSLIERSQKVKALTAKLGNT